MNEYPEDKEVPEKLYHNRFPGSNFIDKDGRVHEFLGGNLRTKSKNLQAELDAIANKAGSPVHTTEHPIESPAERAPREEIQKRAAEVSEQLKRVQQAAVGG